MHMEAIFENTGLQHIAEKICTSPYLDPKSYLNLFHCNKSLMNSSLTENLHRIWLKKFLNASNGELSEEFWKKFSSLAKERNLDGKLHLVFKCLIWSYEHLSQSNIRNKWIVHLECLLNNNLFEHADLFLETHFNEPNFNLVEAEILLSHTMEQNCQKPKTVLLLADRLQNTDFLTTLIFNAASNPNSKGSSLVQILAPICPFPNGMQDAYGNTSLHHAAKIGHIEMVKALLPYCSISDISQQNHIGQTAFDLASDEYPEIFNLFLKHVIEISSEERLSKRRKWLDVSKMIKCDICDFITPNSDTAKRHSKQSSVSIKCKYEVCPMYFCTIGSRIFHYTRVHIHGTLSYY